MKKFVVKAVLIDLDGTLIHTAPEIAQSANKMLVSLGLPKLSPAKIESYIGEGALVLIKRCLTDGASEPDAELLAKAQALFFVAYANCVADSQPYPNVKAYLQLLQQTGFKLACITNKPAAFTLPLLEKAGLLQYFDEVVSGDTLPKKKPEPDQIFYICDKFAVSANETVLIGDSITDVAAARNAGCYIFTVPYGYNQGYSIEKEAVDARIDNIGDAVALIRN